ncbi:hypothetical protein BDQ17DRAFT_1345916 [Cyathus striatus]|nr:hypothetical protein BDQ17DRAFT_1345916 [Cyathus striatus]
MNNNLLLLLLSPIFLLILMAVKCIKALILFAVGLLLLLLGAAEITCNWTMARFGTYTAEADAEDAGKATKAREATLALDDVQLAPSSPAESKSYLIPGNNKAISDQENLSPRNSEGYMKLSRARSASYEDILASQDTEVSRITLMGDLCSWSKFVVRDFVWPMIVGGPWTVSVFCLFHAVLLL